VLQGIGDVGWAIGSARLLFVSVVPANKNMEYMALYYAWIGLISGLSQLLGGWALDLTAGFQRQIGSFTFDPYSILMASALLLTALSIWLFRGVRGDSPVSVGQFAGLFLRGNPFLAIGSVIRYYMARDEQSMVSMTERLGQAHSLLAVDELLDALQDPRFNVRFEAIISIARMGPDPRLTAALIKVMRGKSPALSVIAAWALGRTGDPTAIEPLREGLDSTYRSIQSHSARALATLGDRASIPQLLARLPVEPDYGLQVSYASALGKLNASEATATLLPLLAASDDETVRMELALAVARTVGPEDYFIRLLRQSRSEPGTALAQAVNALRRKVLKISSDQAAASTLMEACADALAREDLTAGAEQLRQLLSLLPGGRFQPSARRVLQECQNQLASWEARRIEYLLLVLHTVHGSNEKTNQVFDKNLVSG
jgi:HEAT repeat protein